MREKIEKPKTHYAPEKNALQRLPEDSVKRWYEKYMTSARFDEIANEASEKGYTLDPRSGIFIKPVEQDKNIRLDHTELKLIIPRPFDVSYHEDVNEYLSVLSGSGAAYLQNRGKNITDKDCFKKIDLIKNGSLFIPKNKMHTLRPNMNEALEVLVRYSGFAKPYNEIKKESFWYFGPYVLYFNAEAKEQNQSARNEIAHI
jgi:mannose-6-phosphate isomerase-like protein (cupin superfamily)